MGLGPADYTALESNVQRYRMWCVPFGTFQARSYTTIEQTKTVQTVGESAWKPVLNIGSHRLAFAGEAISFDGLRSFARGEGLGAGTVSGGHWVFPSASPSGASGIGPHSVSWATPGLYEITYTNDGQTARRWVRVLADRDSEPWQVVSVEGLAGDTTQGWTAQITIVPEGDEAINVADYQCVGLFVEDSWGDPATARTIGGYDPDRRVVAIGYVAQGSIKRDANFHSVSFGIEPLAGQLQNTQVHKTACWFDDAPSTFGTVFTGLPNMKITDAALWLLQFKTNVLEWHDFATFWNGQLQSLESVEGQEASIWGVLESWAKASYCALYGDAGNGLRFAPDRQVTLDGDWEGHHGTRMTIDVELLSLADVSERKQRNVIYVQLTATSTFRMKQIVGEYPDPVPGVVDGPPEGPGSWITRKDLLGNNQSWIDALAERVYLVGNRKWTGTLGMFLCRAAHPGDLVRLTLALDDADVAWTNKLFLVERVTYEVDIGAGTWKTTLAIVEDAT